MLHFPTSSTHIRRLVPHLLVAAALTLTAGCAGGMEPTGDVETGAAPGPSVRIEAGDNFFKPDVLAVRPAEQVTVEIRNTGTRPHDWTSDELGLGTGTMSPGDVFHATFTVPDQDVKFVCTLHAGIDGALRVSR